MLEHMESLLRSGTLLIFIGVLLFLIGPLVVKIDKKRDKRPERTSGTLGDIGGGMCLVGGMLILTGFASLYGFLNI